MGRWVVPGSNGIHIVKLVDANGVDLPGGAASLNLNGANVGEYVYAQLAAPIKLASNTTYYLMTQEFAGGDKWYDYGTLGASVGGIINCAAYEWNGIYYRTNVNQTGYGTPNFLFQ